MIFKVINPSIEQDLYNTINDKQALQTLIRSK